MASKFSAKNINFKWTIQTSSYLLNVEFYTTDIGLINDLSAIADDWFNNGAKLPSLISSIPKNCSFTTLIPKVIVETPPSGNIFTFEIYCIALSVIFFRTSLT